jgi:hypothetical protein
MVYEVRGGNTNKTSVEVTREEQKGKMAHTNEVGGSRINKTGGNMTQEQKAKAYDDFMRRNEQPENGLGFVVQNRQQTKKAARPYPEEVVMVVDDDVEEDDDSSTVVSILSPATW